METERIVELFEAHGVKPTANRIVIARTLAAEEFPMSLTDLEHAVYPIDKSNIFRTLATFKAHHMVHVLEDGSSTRYELCRSNDDEDDEDMHVHFFCEHCHRTFCLYDTPIPEVDLPEGYHMETINYMVKGLCPECIRKGALGKMGT